MALREVLEEADETLPAHVSVAVIGSGFGGIGTAIRLRQAGIDFVILERSDDLGGTWRDNSYPDCACDVPSHLYSFSFDPNPDWRYAFSRQPEILEYLRSTAHRFGVASSIRYRAEVVEAAWDESAQRWDIETARGRLTADALVVATGGLSEPSVPEFAGVERFGGTTFHSAAWRHDHDLRGRRVAVIGTGASSIQFVPAVQQQAEKLTVFQRTAPWVLPRRDRAISALERRFFRAFPAAQRAVRGAIYAGRETWVLGFAVRPDIMKLAEKRARRFLAREVKDPALREKLTPDYRLGCKRVLLSSDYYRALVQPNAEVETGSIVEFTPDGIVTESPDGARTEHHVDTIIFATGFRATAPPIAERIVGREGRTLWDRWTATGMEALRGTTVAGFPNMFYLAGPNTGLGHTSVVLMFEAQIDYLMQAITQMRARGVTAIEPTSAAQRTYSDRVQGRLQRTVWNSGGCRSWYLDDKGRNPTIWPSFTFSFMRELSRFDPAEYHVRRRGAMNESDPAAGTLQPVRAHDGIELAVRLFGPEDGPVVVLSHGWTCSSDFWKRQIAELSGEFRVVAYDQRGHGRSRVPPKTRFCTDDLAADLEAVLEACVPPGRRAVLVGHSMGAMAIVAWAGRYPERVAERAGAALLASTGIANNTLESTVLPMPPSWKLAKRLAGRVFLRSPVKLGKPTALSRRAIRYVTMAPGAQAEDVAFCTEMILRCPTDVRAGWGAVLDGIDLRHAVASLDVPASVLVGSVDRLTPPSLGRRLAAALPRLEALIELPDVGHMAPLEAPGAVNDEIRRLAKLLQR